MEKERERERASVCCNLVRFRRGEGRKDGNCTPIDTRLDAHTNIISLVAVLAGAALSQRLLALAVVAAGLLRLGGLS